MSTPRVPAVSPPVARGLRLGFLDGLRALACLYVLVFHELSAKVTGHGDPSWAMSAILPRLNRGRAKQQSGALASLVSPTNVDPSACSCTQNNGKQ